MKSTPLVLVFGLLTGLPCMAKLAPKLHLRTGIEALNNKGASNGSSVSTGGLDLQFDYFLTQVLAAGVGYTAFFDPGAGTMPIHGYSFVGRYYFYGKGTREDTDSTSWGSAESHVPWAAYGGLQYHKYSYYLGKDPLSQDATGYLTGDYSTIDAAVGVDRPLNRDFEINLELRTTVFSFSATDDRVRITHMGVLFGITYVF